jgi:predicted nucleic acid-binding protein
MKTKVYLDTTVPSAYYDTSKPIRQLITQKWFENDSFDYELYTSVITIQEINLIKNKQKLENIKNLMLNNNVKILEINEFSERLADEYLEKGAIPLSEKEDALHVAIASAHRVESLVSWNFKHIVSVNPIRKIHEINQAN